MKHRTSAAVTVVMLSAGAIFGVIHLNQSKVQVTRQLTSAEPEKLSRVAKTGPGSSAGAMTTLPGNPDANALKPDYSTSVEHPPVHLPPVAGAAGAGGAAMQVRTGVHVPHQLNPAMVEMIKASPRPDGSPAKNFAQTTTFANIGRDVAALDHRTEAEKSGRMPAAVSTAKVTIAQPGRYTLLAPLPTRLASLEGSATNGSRASAFMLNTPGDMGYHFDSGQWAPELAPDGMSIRINIDVTAVRSPYEDFSLWLIPTI